VEILLETVVSMIIKPISDICDGERTRLPYGSNLDCDGIGQETHYIRNHLCDINIKRLETLVKDFN
jgi:hypothetical protein